MKTSTTMTMTVLAFLATTTIAGKHVACKDSMKYCVSTLEKMGGYGDQIDSSMEQWASENNGTDDSSDGAAKRKRNGGSVVRRDESSASKALFTCVGDSQITQDKECDTICVNAGTGNNDYCKF